jgi:hypothetical protein
VKFKNTYADKISAYDPAVYELPVYVYMWQRSLSENSLDGPEPWILAKITGMDSSCRTRDEKKIAEEITDPDCAQFGAREGEHHIHSHRQ